ncbi:ATP-binding cassette domain-containing protein [Cryobacterium serini]|uniref:ATP-binding cassette domain-containing protein n=1 Tax=Cryobacterium serini TaxID=1259201 RepID=A0A4R9BQF2_9MICO|nr:ATP-binding cassette domain-containing protein [Cryobacterium serini]
MSAELLRLDGVSRQYGHGETARTALAGIDLTIMAGEMVAVMGASGSGKSTLLTIAGGLTTPTSGEVVIDGQWISSMTAKQLAVLRRRTLGFVFQDFNLIPALTALENVTLPLELDSWRSRDSRRAGLDALASVGLMDRAGHGRHPGGRAQWRCPGRAEHGAHRRRDDRRRAGPGRSPHQYDQQPRSVVDSAPRSARVASGRDGFRWCSRQHPSGCPPG